MTLTATFNWFKNKLTDVAYECLHTRVNDKCSITARHIRALQELRSKNVVILKPDKSSGAVVMDKTSYVEKMLSILNDRQKFQLLDKEENICLIEERICHQLEVILKHGWIDEKTYKYLKPGGCSSPQLYGLPKTHKQGMPLRPILAMSNSPQHKLARWLVEILKPAIQKFDSYSIKDSLQLADELERINIKNEHMCSIDVQSLFTNVP
ncbi:hypothetical protein AHF37_06135 [Paragonimus kellicotti]|nr:hypothetical protein AHF37_06135 [Paragonimus kellicotti]